MMNKFQCVIGRIDFHRAFCHGIWFFWMSLCGCDEYYCEATFVDNNEIVVLQWLQSIFEQLFRIWFQSNSTIELSIPISIPIPQTTWKILLTEHPLWNKENKFRLICHQLFSNSFPKDLKMVATTKSPQEAILKTICNQIQLNSNYLLLDTPGHPPSSGQLMKKYDQTAPPQLNFDVSSRESVCDVLSTSSQQAVPHE